ncbi:MAG: hypothetical protein WCK01_03415 [Candidatus Uhrbacteria bacterium]
MKKLFEKPLSSNLGKDPDSGTDVEFYDWITGGDSEVALGSFAAALVESLRDEVSVSELTDLLNDWKKRLPEAEFISRLAMLERLMPPNHPYHMIKGSYLK